jgi:hypothetical protein
VSWSGAIDALHADLAAAAADISPTVPIVRSGEPDALVADTIWYAATGRRESSTGGNTLGKVHIERGVEVTALLRGSVRAGSIDASLEARLIDLDAAMLTRLWSDCSLGGHAIGISVGDATYGWADVGGQLARTIVFIVWIDLAEVATIST